MTMPPTGRRGAPGIGFTGPQRDASGATRATLAFTLNLAWTAVCGEAFSGLLNTNTPVATLMRPARVVATGTNTLAIGQVTVDEMSQAVRIPAVVNMR